MDLALPFDRTYWVIPGKFMAGPFPGAMIRTKPFLG